MSREDCSNCALLKRLYVPPLKKYQNIPKDAYVCTLFMNDPYGNSVMFKESKHGMCECFTDIDEIEESCDNCKHNTELWDSEHCDGCCGNHSGFEPQESEEQE